MFTSFASFRISWTGIEYNRITQVANPQPQPTSTGLESPYSHDDFHGGPPNTRPALRFGRNVFDFSTLNASLFGDSDIMPVTIPAKIVMLMGVVTALTTVIFCFLIL